MGDGQLRRKKLVAEKEHSELVAKETAKREFGKCMHQTF